MIQPNLSPVSAPERQRLKGLGHHLKPVVIIGNQGLTDGVLAEINRALSDHELIKIRIAAGDREDRTELAAQCCAQSGAQCIAQTGKMVLIYRRNAKAPHSWAQ